MVDPKVVAARAAAAATLAEEEETTPITPHRAHCSASGTPPSLIWICMFETMQLNKT